MIAAIILTLNEADDLPKCLDSLDWTDQNFVLDSGSTDDTCEIASSMGATVYKNKFKGFGQQRCWAIDNIPVKSDWILFIDADEVCTPKFASAVLDAIQNSKNDTAGFYCCWKLMLYGKWLKLSDSFPRWQFRILKKGKARYRDAGHAMKESDVLGELDYINEPYLHYAFSKGWTFWFNRHNRYSSLEAKEDRITLKGRDTFKLAVKTLASNAQEVLEQAKLQASDVKWLIPHQANLRIIEAAAKRMDFPMDKVLVNIEKFANTSAATIPTALDEAIRDGRVQRGDILLFNAFGAGVTSGANLIRF